MANKDNPLKGSKFEAQVQKFFAKQGLQLELGFSVDVGISVNKKPHKFDLGSGRPPVVVECKSHTWTKGGNAPSAKMSVWVERCPQ